MKKIKLIIEILFSLIKIFKYSNKIEKQVYFIDQIYRFKGKREDYKVRFMDSKIITPWMPMLRVQLRSFFLTQEYRFDLKENPVIIDAGSNIGVGVIYFNYAYVEPKIIALEADKKIFEDYLSKNIKSYGLEKKVDLINKALWSSEGVLKFNATGLDDGAISETGNVTVNSITLDTLIQTHGEIDLLKIDIEGAELEVLKNTSLLHKIKNIYIEMEMSCNQDYEDEILKILKNHSFKYYIRSTTKYLKPNEMFDSKDGITYYLHVFAKRD